MFESYYCMPQRYAFELGAAKGAAFPTQGDIVDLARGLAETARSRAPYFRTPNVLIPWGCDYYYQNSELMFRGADWLIDTINAHPEWGVHAQYCTASEYLAAVRRSAENSSTAFPVKPPGGTFFPYNDWSGYFTSRPVLKRRSAAAHAALHAAEGLFALRPGGGNRTHLWGLLEAARRGAGIVQHHDAITGTYCVGEEGCTGEQAFGAQVLGPHGVQRDYLQMLDTAERNSGEVAAAMLSEPTGLALRTDVEELGRRLMGNGDGGEDGVVVAYNPLAAATNATLSIPIPVCAVDVTDEATGLAVGAQVTFAPVINDGVWPYYDFTLHVVAALPPLGHRAFRVSPRPDARCGGGDAAHGAAAHAAHTVRWQAPGWVLPGAPLAFGDAGFAHLHRMDPARRGEAIDLARRVCAEERAAAECAAEASAAAAAVGAAAVPAAAAAAPSPVVLENPFLKVYIDPAAGLAAVYDKLLSRNFTLRHELVAYASKSNDAYAFTPAGDAAPVLGGAPARAATAALGPVVQECRLQLTSDHKTRIRIWVSADESVGRRIEVANRIGVLPKLTDVAARFHSPDAASPGTLYSEDNGYEAVPHAPGLTNPDQPRGGIAANHYPSQQSVWLRGDTAQLSVALDRSHAVASLRAGELDVVQHRRGGPFDGSGITVVLDDVDRVLVDSWVSLAPVREAGRLRHAHKQALSHPPLLLYAAPPPRRAAAAGAGAAAAAAGLPPALHLQSARALGPDAAGALLRVRHLYSADDAGIDPERAAAVGCDLPGLLRRAGLRVPAAMEEVTLNGIVPLRGLNRTRYPAEEGPPPPPPSRAVDGSRAPVVVAPFELRTFRATF